MSEPKWTPGPWSAHEAKFGWEVVVGERPLYGKSITGWGAVSTTEANARLIAAAPELYEALEALRPYFEGEHYPDHPHCVLIRAALAKARGETP